MELPFGKYSTSAQRTPRIFLLIVLAVTVLGLIPLYHPFNWYPADLVTQYPSEISPTYHAEERKIKIKEPKTCDIFSGEWVRNPDAPYYTNMTCSEIHEHQNCMKYGRPDSDYLKWRWKPSGCELPIFNPFQFLDMVRNKSLAIVGDSVGRNHMQSLICLLGRVEYPVDISDNPDQSFKKYKYTTYNFTLAINWSPFLVSTKEADADGPCHTGLYNLYLDEADEKWTTLIGGYDYIILNAGHWFARCSVYYENNQLVGCRYCGLPNVTELPHNYAYQRAFRTALKAINDVENFKGVAILRTFAPSHYEGGDWNKGGDCIKTRPFRSNETASEGQSLEQYRIQVEEFKVAEKEGKMKGKRFRLMDTTQAMLLRPDGHPSKYGHWPNENVVNDCVHWCLPGPIDSWADFLFHMFKMEGTRFLVEKLQ
ncbi:protein trichome birefringence-like 19 [Nicotiana tabacum]|uniref:Protein trichome birefringence-like 19 n=1 Tax=Nicotiana tabacum TaxID=4097 RepID=A0A1S3ZLL9_TOBAC|nr:protein trichome birefringence-like 19 [Nicotiana tomentosiformis]XP_016465435.1 PREDICTED: protein trichome birefringence-like 19 [Nicotiana tabacum]